MLRTVPLSIIRSFSLYTQQWYISYRFADSLRAKGIRLKGLLTVCEQDQDVSSVLILLANCQQTCMTYTIVVCTVKHS